MSEKNINNGTNDDEDGVEVAELLRQASESSNIHFYNHPCILEVEQDPAGNYLKTKRRFGLSEVNQYKDGKKIINQYRTENSLVAKVLQPHAALLSGDFIESSIAEFCVSLEQLCAKAAIRGQTVIPIYIDSFGGDVYSMLKVLDTIQALRETYGIKFATIAQGKAMSAGAFTLMFGDIGYRYATPRSTIMVHDISTEFGGRMSELQVSYKEAERLSNDVMTSLSNYITQGKNSSHLQDLIAGTKHTDLYLSAKSAKEIGIVDYIGIPKFVFELKLEEKVIPLEQDDWNMFRKK